MTIKAGDGGSADEAAQGEEAEGQGGEAQEAGGGDRLLGGGWVGLRTLATSGTVAFCCKS